MILYHGTSIEKGEGIRATGLNIGSFLSDDPQIAYFYADEVILEISIPATWYKAGRYRNHFLTLYQTPPSKIRKLTVGEVQALAREGITRG